jgi:predicted ribosome quality control (RQC) complex YloA/Tae2 family protein
MKSKIYDNYCIFLGKNQLENEMLLEKTNYCDGTIYWFHLTGRPSAHVILQSHNKPTSKMIKEAAVFLKENSKCKGEKKVEITFMKREFVKQTKFAGTVYLKNNGRTMTI